MIERLRYAIRSLARTPATSLAVVSSLALGLGVSGGAFGVVRSVLDLGPLPEPERLVQINGGPAPPVFDPNGDLDAWAALHRPAFQAVATYIMARPMLSRPEPARELSALLVSPAYFDVLSVRPQLGRVFADDEHRPGAARVIVLSDRLWRQRFASDRSVLGKQASIGGHTFLVIGVMPRGLKLPEQPDAWLPLAAKDDVTLSGAVFARTLGRLRPGTSPNQAQADLAAIVRRENQEASQTVTVVPFARAMRGNAHKTLLILLVAALMVHLVVCMNVTHLMLVRSDAQKHSLALRVAVGASRLDLALLWLVESVLLAGAGALLGIAVASGTQAALLTLSSSASGQAGQTLLGFASAPAISTSEPFRLAGQGIAFLVGLSFLTALAIVAAVIWRTDRAGLIHLLQGHASLGLDPSSRGAMRPWLLATQAALSLVLLIGVGLLARSYARLLFTDLGFDPGHAAALRVVLPEARYPNGARVRAFYQEALGRLRALPGVRAAGATSCLPIGDPGNMLIGAAVEGGQSQSAFPCSVTPGYFDALSIPTLAGRVVAPQDTVNAAPAVLVNESLAKRLWSDSDVARRSGAGVLGSTLTIDQKYTIVGIVGDTRDWGPQREPQATVYYPHDQWPARVMHVVVRFYGDARTRVADVRSVLRTIDSELALGKIEVMTDSVKQATAPERFQMQAMSVLAGVCLLLAALGIAAVTAYDVGRRTREIAVRMSLGAESRQVMMLILRTSLWPIAARCLVGLIASIPFARSLASGLYGIRPWDWPSAVSALVALLAVACAAAYLPARRAAKVDPMVALRCE